MRQLKQISFCLIMIFHSSLDGQSLPTGRTYTDEWSPGDAIGLVFLRTSPGIGAGGAANSGFICPGQGVNFFVAFGDLDNAKCSKGLFKKQYLMAAYEVTYSTNIGTFPNGTSVQTAKEMFRSTQKIPGNPLETFFLMSMETLYLDVPATWSGTPIVVTLTIKDKSPLPTLPDTGSPVDPDLVITTTLNLAPTTLGTVSISHVPDPASPNAIFMVDPGSFGGMAGEGIDYTYLGTSSSGSSLSGLIVNEKIKGPFAALFAFSDITSTFKAANPSIVNADQVAKYMFLPGVPHSFTFDASNMFVDTHAGMAWKAGSNVDVPIVFKSGAITGNRVGYLLDQEYWICSKLMTSKIYRRYRGTASVTAPATSISIRKDH